MKHLVSLLMLSQPSLNNLGVHFCRVDIPFVVGKKCADCSIVISFCILLHKFCLEGLVTELRG